MHATLEVIQKRQTEKPKVRDVAHEVPLGEIKEPRESLEVIDKEHVKEEMLFDNG